MVSRISVAEHMYKSSERLLITGHVQQASFLCVNDIQSTSGNLVECLRIRRKYECRVARRSEASVKNRVFDLSKEDRVINAKLIGFFDTFGALWYESGAKSDNQKVRAAYPGVRFIYSCVALSPGAATFLMIPCSCSSCSSRSRSVNRFGPMLGEIV